MAPRSFDNATGLIDIAIVGAGFAGSALGAVLARQGYQVAMFDAHKVYPEDFRAEKLSPVQLASMDRLGLAEPIVAASTLIEQLQIARLGQLVEQRRVREYGIDYADLVATLRAQVPPGCWSGGRVAALETSATTQTVVLTDGRRYKTRLIVLATGLGKALLDGIGIKRIDVEKHHTLAVGFDLAFSPGTAPKKSLTYHGHSVKDRLAYLTLFPIGDRLRANLFIYRRFDEPWSSAFRAAPRDMLLDIMPGLRGMIPDFTIPTKPLLRPIHLHAAQGYRREGVVLIGDAFSTTCPTGGTGVSKAVNDVDRLAALIPAWLADQTGVGVDKISQFYDDPAKRACDDNARRVIAHARDMAINPGLAWIARRYRNFYALKLRNWVRNHVPRPAGALIGTGRPSAAEP